MLFTSLKKLTIFILLFSVSFALTSCGKKDDASEKKTAKLAYVNWAGTVAMTNLAKVVLENKMGYKVKLTRADVAPVYTSLAQEDQDAFMGAWLPVTHANYLQQYGHKIDTIGINFSGAKIGLVVPKYVSINKIEELNSIKEKFEGRIIGIDSGAGIMGATEKAIEDYKLDLKLLPSSGPAMTASLKSAIDKKEYIVVTGWRPHWKFARFDLKFLEDSKGVYGAAETIYTVAPKTLKTRKPELNQFLVNFNLTEAQLADLMDAIEVSGDPETSATEWMNNNPEVIEKWLPNK